nr:hypothetical protein CUMW_180770 [Ipomoea batatas]
MEALWVQVQQFPSQPELCLPQTAHPLLKKNEEGERKQLNPSCIKHFTVADHRILFARFRPKQFSGDRRGELPEFLPWFIPNDSLVLIPGAAVLGGDHKLVIHAGDDLTLPLDHALKLQIGFSLFVVVVDGELRDLHHLGGFRVRNGAPAADKWIFPAAECGGGHRQREEREGDEA